MTTLDDLAEFGDFLRFCAAYDPDQARDERGRFASSGSSSAAAASGKAKKSGKAAHHAEAAEAHAKAAEFHAKEAARRAELAKKARTKKDCAHQLEAVEKHSNAAEHHNEQAALHAEKANPKPTLKKLGIPSKDVSPETVKNVEAGIAKAGYAPFLKKSPLKELVEHGAIEAMSLTEQHQVKIADAYEKLTGGKGGEVDIADLRKASGVKPKAFDKSVSYWWNDRKVQLGQLQPEDVTPDHAKHAVKIQGTELHTIELRPGAKPVEQSSSNGTYWKGSARVSMADKSVFAGRFYDSQRRFERAEKRGEPIDRVPGDHIWSLSSLATSADEMQERTTVHELGHHIHLSTSHPLSDDLMDKIEDAYHSRVARTPEGRTVTAAGKWVPSEYSRKNEKEWFTEAHTAFVYHPDVLRSKDPEAYALVQSVRKARGLP